MVKPRDEKFPACIPVYYRIFCKLRKAKRQAMVRLNESKARRDGPIDVLPDGVSAFTPLTASSKTNPAGAINKSGLWSEEDLSSPGIKSIADNIEALKAELKSRNLRCTSSTGTFVERLYTPRSERDKSWENAWIIRHSGAAPAQEVLEIGGASTAFVFYLAKMGCRVKVIDNDWGCCGIIYNTNYAAKAMGWDIEALDRDIAKPLPFPPESFDRVFSICTLEHLPSSVRRRMMREVSRVLRPGGIAGLTFDYDPSRKVLTSDKGLRFGYARKLFEEVIEPSGLSLAGNTELIDIYPEKNFVGAMFLKK